ncbi:MAG TPA: hypothetical protein VH599_17740 [Ktedonobacterales bacterium]|jgi:uncharacterized protein YceK
MKATSKRKRFWLPLVILALAVALALGGCARSVQNTGASSSQTTNGAGNSGQTSTNDELNHLQQIDQQNQHDSDTLDNDEQNANQDSGTDQEIIP